MAQTTWELNYEDREALRKVLVSRCVQAVRKYALYLLDQPAPDPVTPLYTAKMAWAREAMRNLQSLGEQLSHYVTAEPSFLSKDSVDGGGGTSISDAKLGGCIENAINNHFIVVAE